MKASLETVNFTVSKFKDIKDTLRNATFVGAIFHGLTDYQLNRGNDAGIAKLMSILETIVFTPIVYTTKLFDYVYNYIFGAKGTNYSMIQKVQDIGYNALNFFRSYTFSRTIDVVSGFLDAALKNQPAAYTLFGYGISSPMIMAGAGLALELITLGCEVAGRFYNKSTNDKIRALKSIDINHSQIVSKLNGKYHLASIVELKSELDQNQSIIDNKYDYQKKAQDIYKPNRLQLAKTFAEICAVYSLNLVGTYGIVYSVGGNLKSLTKTLGFLFSAFTLLIAKDTIENKKTEYVITNSYGLKNDLAGIKQKAFDLEVKNKLLSANENALSADNFTNLYNQEAKKLYDAQPSNSFLASFARHAYDEFAAGTNLVNPIDKINYRDGSIDIAKFQTREITRRQSPGDKIHRY